MSRLLEPVGIAVASLAAVGTSLWLDLATTDAQRASAGTEAATSTALPGLLLAAASVVVLSVRPGDVVGRLLGLVAVEIVVRAITRAPESTQSAAAMDYKTEP